MSRTHRHFDPYDLWFHPERAGRDHKPFGKPPSIFKRTRRRTRRAKEQQALREGKEIPRFKRSDVWDWN